jgi:hypothetical protein
MGVLRLRIGRVEGLEFCGETCLGQVARGMEEHSFRHWFELWLGVIGVQTNIP